MSPSRFFSFSRLFPGLLLGVCTFLSGCVYFNTYYNAQKAYDQAIALRAKRLDRNPGDSVLASVDEKIKFERCITKCSKVLELYPDEKKWQLRAVFLMAEAYYQQGEWTRSIGKYDEFLQYFPGAPQTPAAEVHRAIALFKNGQYPAAHSALTRMLASPLDDGLRTEALLCLADMEGVSGNDSTSLAAYERLLKEAAQAPYSRALAHASAARLAFSLKQWTKVREHALAPEVELLPVRRRMEMALLAADALYAVGRFEEGVSEIEKTSRLKVYRDTLAPFQLKMAEGHLALKRHEPGFALIGKVTRSVPRTAWSAEGWYRRGEHELRILKDEPAARISFDSAAAQGSDFAYAKQARDRAEALAALAEYRKKKGDTASVAASPWRDEFMIAELFVFKLDAIDSALVRLNRIADAPRQDSAFTLRAEYARAYIYDEYKGDKALSDSLYRLILQRHPGTAYAQQAERNLGLKTTVQTGEDSAHALFVEAEKLRYSGGDLAGQVLPAYAKVASAHPLTAAAAQAQFVMAMIHEGEVEGLESARNLDSAKVAYARLREAYPQSPYAPRAQAKLLTAGISSSPASAKPGDKPAGTPTQAEPGQPAQPPAQPGAGSEGLPDVHPEGRNTQSPNAHGPGPASESMPAATPDTTTPPEGKTREVLEPDYDNVDQY